MSTPTAGYRSVTDGAETSGRWEVRRGLVCYSALTPAPAAPLCSLGPKKKVGAKWKVFLSDDASVKVSIVPGR